MFVSYGRLALYVNFRENKTDMESDTLLDELRVLEERLLMPLDGSAIDECAMLMADDFREIGSSGACYNKAQALQAMGQRQQPQQAHKTSLSDFQLRSLAPGVVLLTYRAHRQTINESVHSLRSSIWKRDNGQWRILFHQGTPTHYP